MGVSHPPPPTSLWKYSGLLNTMLKALGNEARNHWDTNAAEVTRLVNTRRSANHPGPAKTKPLHNVGGDKVTVVHIRK